MYGILIIYSPPILPSVYVSAYFFFCPCVCVWVCDCVSVRHIPKRFFTPSTGKTKNHMAFSKFQIEMNKGRGQFLIPNLQNRNSNENWWSKSFLSIKFKIVRNWFCKKNTQFFSKKKVDFQISWNMNEIAKQNFGPLLFD